MSRFVQLSAGMIEWIEFRNFKALRNAKLPLSQFTLIVGPNGSGKSSALNAVLALNNPGRWNSNQVRTAGLPSAEPIVLRAKWNEAENDFVVELIWLPTGGYNGPLYTPD